MQHAERSPAESYFWPVVLAVGLHVIIFGLLFVSFAMTPDLPPSKPIVQATLYQLKSQSQATTQTNQKIAGEAKKTAAKQYETEQMEQRKVEQQKQAAAKAAEQRRSSRLERPKRIKRLLPRRLPRRRRLTKPRRSNSRNRPISPRRRLPKRRRKKQLKRPRRRLPRNRRKRRRLSRRRRKRLKTRRKRRRPKRRKRRLRQRLRVKRPRRRRRRHWLSCYRTRLSASRRWPTVRVIRWRATSMT